MTPPYHNGCGWMYRRSDSPADLATAVDGLQELASAFATAASEVTDEIQRRIQAGTVAGVDEAKLTKAPGRRHLGRSPSFQQWRDA